MEESGIKRVASTHSIDDLKLKRRPIHAAPLGVHRGATRSTLDDQHFNFACHVLLRGFCPSKLREFFLRAEKKVDIRQYILQEPFPRISRIVICVHGGGQSSPLHFAEQSRKVRE